MTYEQVSNMQRRKKKPPLTSFFKSIRIFRPAGQANMQRVLWDLGPASLKGWLSSTQCLAAAWRRRLKRAIAEWQEVSSTLAAAPSISYLTAVRLVRGAGGKERTCLTRSSPTPRVHLPVHIVVSPTLHGLPLPSPCFARFICCPCAQLSCEGFSLLVSFPPQPYPWILFMIVCPNIHLFNLLHHHCPSPREDQSSNWKIQNRWTTNSACAECDLLHRLFRSWSTDFTWCLCQEWSVCIAPTPTCTRMRVRKRERVLETSDIMRRGVVLVPVCRPNPTFPWPRRNKKSGEREMDVREELKAMRSLKRINNQCIHSLSA